MIQLHRVTKRYPNGIEALRDVTVRIHEGEFAFVSGRTGAGKSTLLSLVLGDLQPTEGALLVDGRNLGVMKPSQLPYFRRSVGVLWQDVRLLEDRTARENVALALEVLGLPAARVRRRVDQVLEMVGMERDADTPPAWLSTGEQQRVALARALVNEPKLIVADEPTGDLDPELSAELVQMLRDISARGATVVLATHDRALIDAFPERVVLLNQGFLIEDEGDLGGLPHEREPRAP